MPTCTNNPMRLKRNLIIAWMMAGMLVMAPLFVYAQDARLTNIIVTNTRDDLLLYLTVQGAFPPKIEQAISSGVPTTFSFFVNLYRKRPLWPDAKIAELNLTHTIKYDSLRQEYQVSRSWDQTTTHTVKTFKEAKKLMTEIDSLTTAPLDKLEKGQRYQVRAKAKLSRLTLPFYLHYILFFVSLWDFETDWYTIDFIY